jgi:hypothetical protein
MGNFLTNYQIRAASAPAVVTAARPILAGRAAISPAHNGWITLYDETSESQDPDERHRVAQALSAALHTFVLAFLVHDSDILHYLLYENGHLLDEFDSQPDYFSDADDATWNRLAGSPKALARCCPSPPPPDAVAPLLTRTRKYDAAPRPFADALQRLHAFAAPLGIDPQRIALGFNDYRDMRADAPDAFKKFRNVRGTGRSAEQSRPRSFIDLVRQGDLDGVRQALAQGADPNQMLLPQHFSAIACAADAAQPEIAMLLLDAGANPSAGKLSALGSAIVRGLKPLVRTLLARGADARAHDFDLVLSAVLFHDDVELLELLIAHGASVQGSPESTAPLLVAVSTGKSRLAQALLAAGADPHVPGPRGMTALTIAAARNDAAMIEILRAAGAQSQDTPSLQNPPLAP